jgi:hypothetical protein
MANHKPVASYLLDGQIELLIHSRQNRILRTVSHDGGEHWLEWTGIKNHQSDRPVGFAATADARCQFMAYRIFNPLKGTPMEDTFEHNHQLIFKLSRNFGFDWTENLTRVGPGSYSSGAAVVCTPNGNGIHVFGLRGAGEVWWLRSKQGGVTGSWMSSGLGGSFKSEPAAVISADGQTIMIFGIGMDDRCWYAHTSNGGDSWNVLWGPIGNKHFNSGPGACISADGKNVIIAAREPDDRFFCNRSTDGGATWRPTWEPILAGVFNGGPALCGSWDLGRVYVFGVGRDDKIWKAHLEGAGGAFSGWWPADQHGSLKAI